jgi:signal transduction histidine kinase
VLRANAPWLELVGAASEDAAIGRDVIALLPGQGEALSQAVARARAGELATVAPQPYSNAGADAWWEGTVVPLGSGRGVLVVCRDVTRTRAAEREARAATERVTRLQHFTAALSSAVTMKDVARVLVEQGLEQFGARAVGIMWAMRSSRLDFVFGHGVSEPEFRMLDAAARRGERLPVRDAVLGRKAIWLETAEELRARYPVLEPLRALRGETGCAVVPLVVGERCPGVIGFTFDRARRLAAAERAFVETLAQLSAQAFDRARLFEAEQEARREAERARKAQEQLMAVVGHDLRTPLSSIRIAAWLLAKRGDLTPEQAGTVKLMASSAGRMSALLRDLLDLDRARHGLGVALDRERVDLGELAERTILEFTDGAARLTLAASGDLALDGDPGRLAQVLSNLVGNALQHGAGTPVKVALAGGEGAVVVTVHNGGPPIPAELLPEVFEPFRRGAAPGARRGSVGLGLFIVREIVRAHGGAVEVHSTADAGTTFTVRLPRGAR